MKQAIPEIDILWILQRLLRRRREITLLTATHGEEGLKLARSSGPDLILLDLYLPDIQGDEILARLRADEATAEIPVIMINADATTGQADRLLAAGAQAYITKPLDVEVLLQTIDRTLRVPAVDA